MHGFTIKITTNGFRMCEGKAFEIRQHGICTNADKSTNV